MSRLRSIWKRRALRAGLGVFALGSSPLLLYGGYVSLAGVSDANPVGLGLLMFFSTPIALALMAVGIVQGLLGHGDRDRRERLRDGRSAPGSRWA